jgi:hypothetical protein
MLLPLSPLQSVETLQRILFLSVKDCDFKGSKCCRSRTAVESKNTEAEKNHGVGWDLRMDFSLLPRKKCRINVVLASGLGCPGMSWVPSKEQTME